MCIEIGSISVNKAFIKKNKLFKELALKITITTTKLCSNHVKANLRIRMETNYNN